MTRYHYGYHEHPYDPLDCPACAEWDILAGIERATEDRSIGGVTGEVTVPTANRVLIEFVGSIPTSSALEADEEEARQERIEHDGSITICALLTGFIWLSAFGLELGGNRLTALFFFGLGLMFFGGTLALWAKSEEEE